MAGVDSVAHRQLPLGNPPVPRGGESWNQWFRLVEKWRNETEKPGVVLTAEEMSTRKRRMSYSLWMTLLAAQVPGIDLVDCNAEVESFIATMKTHLGISSTTLRQELEEIVAGASVCTDARTWLSFIAQIKASCDELDLEDRPTDAIIVRWLIHRAPPALRQTIISSKTAVANTFTTPLEMQTLAETSLHYEGAQGRSACIPFPVGNTAATAPAGAIRAVAAARCEQHDDGTHPYTFLCFNCGKEGHMSRECTQPETKETKDARARREVMMKERGDQRGGGGGGRGGGRGGGGRAATRRCYTCGKEGHGSDSCGLRHKDSFVYLCATPLGGLPAIERAMFGVIAGRGSDCDGPGRGHGGRGGTHRGAPSPPDILPSSPIPGFVLPPGFVPTSTLVPQRGVHVLGDSGADISGCGTAVEGTTRHATPLTLMGAMGGNRVSSEVREVPAGGQGPPYVLARTLDSIPSGQLLLGKDHITGWIEETGPDGIKHEFIRWRSQSALVCPLFSHNAANDASRLAWRIHCQFGHWNTNVTWRWHSGGGAGTDASGTTRKEIACLRSGEGGCPACKAGTDLLRHATSQRENSKPQAEISLKSPIGIVSIDVCFFEDSEGLLKVPVLVAVSRSSEKVPFTDAVEISGRSAVAITAAMRGMGLFSANSQATALVADGARELNVVRRLFERLTGGTSSHTEPNAKTHNPVAERFVRTLRTAVRTRLALLGLSPKGPLWRLVLHDAVVSAREMRTGSTPLPAPRHFQCGREAWLRRGGGRQSKTSFNIPCVIAGPCRLTGEVFILITQDLTPGTCSIRRVTPASLMCTGGTLGFYPDPPLLVFTQVLCPDIEAAQHPAGGCGGGDGGNEVDAEWGDEDADDEPDDSSKSNLTTENLDTSGDSVHLLDASDDSESSHDAEAPPQASSAGPPPLPPLPPPPDEDPPTSCADEQDDAPLHNLRPGPRASRPNYVFPLHSRDPTDWIINPIDKAAWLDSMRGLSLPDPLLDLCATAGNAQFEEWSNDWRSTLASTDALPTAFTPARTEILWCNPPFISCAEIVRTCRRRVNQTHRDILLSLCCPDVFLGADKGAGVETLLRSSVSHSFIPGDANPLAGTPEHALPGLPFPCSIILLRISPTNPSQQTIRRLFTAPSFAAATTRLMALRSRPKDAYTGSGWDSSDAESHLVESAKQAEISTWESWNVFEPTAKPASLDLRWILRRKKDGVRARLCVREFASLKNESNEFRTKEYYSPTPRIPSQRIAALAAILRGEVVQLDVQKAFLHAEKEHPVVVRPPPEWTTPETDPDGRSNWNLIRSAYGCRKSGREWWGKVSGIFGKNGWLKTLSDRCTFYRPVGAEGEVETAVVVVDDVLTTSPTVEHELTSEGISLGTASTVTAPGSLVFAGVEIDMVRPGYGVLRSDNIEKFVSHVEETLSTITQSKNLLPPLVNPLTRKETNNTAQNVELWRSHTGGINWLAQQDPTLSFVSNWCSAQITNPYLDFDIFRSVAGFLQPTDTTEKQHNSIRCDFTAMPIADRVLIIYADASHAGLADVFYDDGVPHVRDTIGYIGLIINRSALPSIHEEIPHGIPIFWKSKKVKTQEGSSAGSEVRAVTGAIEEGESALDSLIKMGILLPGSVMHVCFDAVAITLAQEKINNMSMLSCISRLRDLLSIHTVEQHKIPREVNIADDLVSWRQTPHKIIYACMDLDTCIINKEKKKVSE